jgi:DNA-binding transcriptional ArsR family regulator
MVETDSIHAVMRALADPTRRAVFERVAANDEISVAELTRGSGVTQGAISQHLKSLKQAGLVAERPEGRNVFYRAAPDGLSPLADWLKSYHRFWSGRLDVLEELLRDEDAHNIETKGARR